MTPNPCSNHARANNGIMEFLLITDQRDSSKSPHNEVGPRTARHFNTFVPALCSSAKIVKNIGDSLMVHVQLKSTKFPDFLSRILKAQKILQESHAQTNGEHSGPVPIRIVMIHLDPREHLTGQEIKWESLRKGDAEIPPNRTSDCAHWLCGDLFGSSVALAFRGASVPKEDIVVVDRRLIRAWKSDAMDSHFSEDSLHFGPVLAFSPFKGLEDIYKFGGGGPVEESSWEGHLFLRMVGNSKDDVVHTPNNPLVLDQQKVRVFTDIVWIGNAPDEEMKKLRHSLEKKQKRNKQQQVEFPAAEYVRFYAKVLMKKEFPEGDMSLSHDVDVVLIGAYPNPDAYFAIRNELSELWAERTVRYAYPVTNEVYPDEYEMKTAFWNPNELRSPFILIFARWSEPDRLNPSSTAESRINLAIQKAGMQGALKVIRCGLIQGGLWDIYATLNIGEFHNINVTNLASICDKLLEVCFASTTVRLCEEIPAENRKN
jgi:hypothetical protein